MGASQTLRLPLRRGRLHESAAGHTTWETVSERRSVPAERAALVLCDVWDQHWCRGAAERLTALLPRLNLVAATLRSAGVLIVHAPSETMDFYAGTPAGARWTRRT